MDLAKSANGTGAEVASMRHVTLRPAVVPPSRDASASAPETAASLIRVSRTAGNTLGMRHTPLEPFCGFTIPVLMEGRREGKGVRGHGTQP
jgi:hypothetical protein